MYCAWSFYVIFVTPRVPRKIPCKATTLPTKFINLGHHDKNFQPPGIFKLLVPDSRMENGSALPHHLPVQTQVGTESGSLRPITHPGVLELPRNRFLATWEQHRSLA